MIIKERKYQRNELKYSSIQQEENNNNFIILDDKTFTIDNNFQKVKELIESYNYKVDVIDIKKTAEVIVNFLKKRINEFDTIICAGTGGKQLYNSIEDKSLFKEKEVVYLEWHRTWDNEQSLGFETNIDEFSYQDKRIIILEDVIASGNTLYTMMKEIEDRGGKVVEIYSAMIQESSPIIKKSFMNIFSVVKIKKPENPSLDPFWYPPIYSLRHLYDGDSEMENFYQILNDKYFNGEDKVERFIKKIRG